MSKSDLLKALSRRKFLRNSVVAVTGAAVAPSLLSGCSDDDTITFTPEGTPEVDFGFLEGVASFDPTQTQIVLWSRYTPDTNEESNPTILLDVATDADFTEVVASESVAIDTNSDNTIIVDLDGLTAGSQYYYRFRNDVTGITSPVGQTITLPNVADEVKLAVVSCANYPAGQFNVYGAVAESDVDVVVHLGDYIYEYSAGGYGTGANGTSLPERAHTPDAEILTIEDYRGRYRQYRSDAQLQKAHQLKPFICVWDDHEITNDTWKEGAENHQPETEGSFEDRKARALQVWHEYLPARVSDNAKIYRNFEIGGLVNLMMLDTRVVGRDKQIDVSEYITETGAIDAAGITAALSDTERTILGAEQRSWLGSTITASTSTWNVLGSQVLMAKYFIPLELAIAVAPLFAGATPTEDDFIALNSLLSELAAIKFRILSGDPTITEAERARVEVTFPYNLDAWDGYPVEREIIFGTFKEQNKKMVSIAGDTHNAWFSKNIYQNLLTGEKTEVGAEFATSSVTSPGFEGVLGNNNTDFEQAMTLLIDDLEYLNSYQRGFLKMTFTPGEAKGEWNYVNTLQEVDTSTSLGHTRVVS